MSSKSDYVTSLTKDMHNPKTFKLFKATGPTMASVPGPPYRSWDVPGLRCFTYVSIRYLAPPTDGM